jgi:hypothetical protein
MSGLVSQLLGHQSGTSTMLELQDRTRELARSMSRPEDGGGNPTTTQEDLSTLLVLGSIAMASLMRSSTADSTNTGGAVAAALAAAGMDAGALQATPQPATGAPSPAQDVA